MVGRVADHSTTQDLIELLEQDPTADQLRGHGALRDPASVPPVAGLTVASILLKESQPEDLPVAGELAKGAFEVGLPEAGPILANCIDQMSLFSQRPQPFGTVVVEQGGEPMLAPVDPTITDEVRADYGVPPLAELEAKIEEQAKDRARRNLSAESIIGDQGFCRVWTDLSESDLSGRIKDSTVTGGSLAQPMAVWAENDVLHFAAETSEPFVALPVFGIPSWAAGPFQVLSVRVDRLDEAVITYKVRSLSELAAGAGFGGGHDGRYRGPGAPVELSSNDPVAGSLIEAHMESDAFDGPRKVTVYKPRSQHSVGTLPVIYATDGNMFAPFARRLDAAISEGLCPAVVVVAAHAADVGPMGANNRAAEYLQGFEPAIHRRHEEFFTHELLEWAETTLKVTTERSQRAIFGTSDGGGHALATGMAHRDKFGHIFAYSTGMAPALTQPWDPTLVPRVELCAGTLEGPFHTATAAWAYFLERVGADCHFTERVAGHDLIQWAEELPRSINRAWREQ